MGLWPVEICLLLLCGDRLQSSESDVYRRQVLTTKVNSRAVRINPTCLHVYSITDNKHVLYIVSETIMLAMRPRRCSYI